MPLIDRAVLWQHALAQASATYDPDRMDVIHVRRRDNSPWFDVALPPNLAIHPDRTIGVMIKGRGWIMATPARPS